MNTTITSPGALALGMFFALVTAATILKDVVIDGAAINLTHVQSLAAMVAAIAAGHCVLPALKKKQVGYAAGLLAVFCAATGYIVVAAGARNAETAGLKAQAIEARNQQRAAAREVLMKAEAETAEAKAAADKAIKEAAAECASGRKGKCIGKEATREAAKDDLTKAKDAESLARGKLLLLGVDENPYEGYHHAARTLEAIGIGSTAVTEAKLELLMPFALVLISEIATLIFIGMAIGRKLPVSTVSKPVSDSGNSGGGKAERLPIRLVEDHELVALKEALQGGRALTNDELTVAMGLRSKGEASKRVTKGENLGIVRRERVGKHVRITLCHAH